MDVLLTTAARKQATVITRAWDTDARGDAQALVAAAGDELPAPQWQWQHLWNTALWTTALGDAENLVAAFVVEELDIEFGIQVVSTQPFVERLAAARVAGIEAWTLDLKRIVGEVIDRGHREAMSVKQVADALQDMGVSTEKQAKLIARDQMIATSNEASYRGATAIAEPGDRKKWLHSNDARVRKTHRRVDEVPFDEPFNVGGHAADFPADSRLPADEAIGCRCTWILVPG